MKGRTPDLNQRLKQFALRVLSLIAALPRQPEADIFRRQLCKSGTSPGAHYREARRARSNAEFVSKMNGGLQELDETDWWLELLLETSMVDRGEVALLRQETDELIAIFVTCIKNAKG